MYGFVIFLKIPFGFNYVGKMLAKNIYLCTYKNTTYVEL